MTVLPLRVTGRNWMNAVTHSGSEYVNKCTVNQHEQLTKEHTSLLAPELGKFTWPPVSTPMNEKSQTIFPNTRAVPIELRQRVESESRWLVDQDSWSQPTIAAGLHGCGGQQDQ